MPGTSETVRAGRVFVAARDQLNLDDEKGVWMHIGAVAETAKLDAPPTARFREPCAHGGLRLEQTSQWLGHADLKTTQRYLRVVDGGKANPSRRVGSHEPAHNPAISRSLLDAASISSSVRRTYKTSLRRKLPVRFSLGTPTGR